MCYLWIVQRGAHLRISLIWKKRFYLSRRFELNQNWCAVCPVESCYKSIPFVSVSARVEAEWNIILDVYSKILASKLNHRQWSKIYKLPSLPTHFAIEQDALRKGRKEMKTGKKRKKDEKNGMERKASKKLISFFKYIDILCRTLCTISNTLIHPIWYDTIRCEREVSSSLFPWK